MENGMGRQDTELHQDITVCFDFLFLLSSNMFLKCNKILLFVKIALMLRKLKEGGFKAMCFRQKHP